MKTKIPLTLVLLLLLTSCIKDYLGGGDKGITLTETNYVYEGELYKLYLTSEIEKLTLTINELEEIINNNQGDEQTEADLKAAIEEKNNLSIEIENIIDIVGRGIVPPRPPCPNGDLCLPKEFQYLISDRDISIISFDIFDQQGNSLVGNTSPTTRKLLGSKNLLNYQDFTITDFTGVVEIKVVKQDSQQVLTTYSISVFKE